MDRTRSSAPGLDVRGASTLEATALGLFRIVVGFLFFVHGTTDLFGFPAMPWSGHLAAFASWPYWWAGLIELVGGFLVMIGLGTRGAALICSGAMAYAYFTVHQPHGALPILNGGEPAALYSWAFLLIAAVGPGAFAVGSVMHSRGRGDRASRRRRLTTTVSPL
ncbi:DoxX family protein [Rhodococcus spelaei]|uniref:DoxX family protein n=1 Tax=Rhodococcus spelaei TaxID=2546320 RepID=A0A541B8S7_9NOCA|nr:DoxX family protein [Rhodococcus spelaei]TQF68730.1 DoxX family protein [Rhodococcus spelaei]